jgi:CBS domain-containing protein
MDQSVRSVMTPNPAAISLEATLTSAARTMRDMDVGTIVVTDDGRPVGIITDRDIVVRGLASGRSPNSSVAEVCSKDLTTVSESDKVEEVVQVMRERKLRRLPVTRAGTLVGIVSLGDLAVKQEPDSVLAEITAAPPNR